MTFAQVLSVFWHQQEVPILLFGISLKDNVVDSCCFVSWLESGTFDMVGFVLILNLPFAEVLVV
jgi:hypothetical protein